jgi:acetyl/propionyl-CoA carboxylase alpha subunit
LTYDDTAGTLTIAGEVEDDLSNNDTDDLAEGTTNLYYTTARFDTAFSGKSTTDLSEGTNLYYTTARFDTAFSGKSTTDLSEGTNLYFTDERVDDRVNNLLVAGTNITLTYDDTANTLTITGTDTQLSQEQVEDFVDNVLVAGTNVTITYDDTAGTITIASTDTQLTQEEVEDYVGGLIAAGSGISVTYDDTAGTLTIANTASTSTEEVQDIVGDMLVTNGTHTGITFSYDDAGDGAIDATVSLPASDEILDADSDTKIQVEESADEDIIRFDTAGVERATLAGALDLTDDGGAFIHSQTQAGTYTINSGKGTLFAGPITITGTVTNAGTMVVI